MEKHKVIFKCRDLWIIILLLAIALIFFFITYEPKQTETVELARRIVSQSKQKKIFSRIEEYYSIYQHTPISLSELVDKGYLSKEEILTPPISKKDSQNVFDYNPESYNEPNAVILSDVRIAPKEIENKMDSVAIETHGDGSVIVRVIGKNKR